MREYESIHAFVVGSVPALEALKSALALRRAVDRLKDIQPDHPLLRPMLEQLDQVETVQANWTPSNLFAMPS